MARRLGDRFEVDFHLQVAETATVAEGHAIAGRIKADILRSHPEVIAVLVHVEPDHPEHLKPDGLKLTIIFNKQMSLYICFICEIYQNTCVVYERTFLTKKYYERVVAKTLRGV